MNPPYRILLAVAGATPATITEAVWALAVDRKLALDEIRVLTTRAASKQIGAALADALALLHADYPKATFPRTAIVRIARLAKGTEIDDIRTSAENEEMADWMLREVREACSGEGTEVHASLAGGRKTMSFLLGAAMQLCARPQDRLYHVLVPPEFEVPRFFFPRAKRAKDWAIPTRDGKTTVDARKASVDMADVPFVRLGTLLPETDVKHLTFRQMMSQVADSLSDEFGDVSVIVPDRGKSGKAIIRIAPTEATQVDIAFASVSTQAFVVYTWLLSRRKRGLPPLLMMDQERFQEHLDDLVVWCERLGLPEEKVKEYRDLEGTLAEARRKNLKDIAKDKDYVSVFFEKDWYGVLKVFPSRLRREFQKKFASQAPGYDSGKYAIVTQEENRRQAAWHVRIPPENIHLPGETRRKGKK
ncbi:MAG: hypothetical protein PWP23_2373 [Candidatus Sumerlaeota bacterium]|nr:hypothetical protein [Candidatus Sumerlaeota bacterium]